MKLKRLLSYITSFIFIGIIVSLAIPISIESSNGANWTKDGNKVYIDNNNAYLSATPHTITSSGWVEFELKNKKYGGNIDALLGFSEDITIRKTQIWNENAQHTTFQAATREASGNIVINEVTFYEELSKEKEKPDIGNNNNSKLIKVYNQDNNWFSPLVIACNSYEELTPTSIKIHYNYNEDYIKEQIEVYPDWEDITYKLRKEEAQLDKYIDWKSIKNINSVKNNTYKFRVWIDIPFSGLNTIEGEYLWGVKPSGESLEFANSQNRLYLLDPWYNSSWDYRKRLTFDNTDSSVNLTDFITMVSFNSTTLDFDNCRDDGYDIRFTDSDGETLLDYFRATWDNTTEEAVFQVEVPQIDAGSTTDHIYVYYGNAGASDGEGYTNFPSNLILNDPLFTDRISGAFDSFESNELGHAIYGTPAHSANGFYFDGVNEYLNLGNPSEFHFGTYATFIMWIKPGQRAAGANAHPIISKGTWGTSGDWELLTDKSAGYWNLSSDGAVDTASILNMNESTWYCCSAVCDNSTWYWYTDNTTNGTDPINPMPANSDDNVRIGCETGLSRDYKGYISTIMVWDEALDEDEVLQYYLSYKHHYGVGDSSNFITFGTEAEEADVPTVSTGSVQAKSIDKDGNANVTVNITVSDVGEVPSYIWTEYGTTISYGSFSDNQSANATGNYTSTITEVLVPSTTYHYRAAANNAIGTGNGTDSTFSLTMPTTATGTANQSDSTATLSGHISNMGDASNVYAYFEWGYDVSYGNTSSNSTETGIGDFNQDITGYNAGQTIHYRSVLTINGVDSYGSDATFEATSAVTNVYRLATIIPIIFIVIILLGGAALIITGDVEVSAIIALAIVIIIAIAGLDAMQAALNTLLDN